jgi:uncharacterized repeat protein (TIGR01451 family)
MRKHILTHIIDPIQLNQLKAVLLRSRNIVYLLAFTGFIQFSHAQCPAGELKGSVFLDLNFNGLADANDGFKSQVAIRAFDVNNLLVSQVVTDGNGNFTITGLSNNKTYRLEMIKPQGFEYANGGLQDVQFCTTPLCNIKFGLQDKKTACNPNTAKVFTSCFVQAGTSETAPTLVQFPFQFNAASPITKLAMQNQTGSVWGLSWNQSKQLLYSSAFVKYGSPLGSAGTSGIYVTDAKLGTTQVFLDLSQFGFQTGNLNGILPLDCRYSDFVGKAGFADMDISDDDQYLYVTNLFRNSIMIIPTNHPSATNIFEIKVPDPGCNNGNYAVGAVEYRNNHLYIGVTCTAETSKSKSDFFFHIYEFNLISRTFNIIFSTSFARQFWAQNPGSSRPVSQWLTNISFVNDQFMVLGISDRTGHTYCDKVYPLTGQNGDILMLWKNGNQWQLEHNSIAGPRFGSGSFHTEGPGGGEFFGDDFWTIGPGLHPETSFGSVAVLSGTEEVISSVFDPIYESFSGGFHKYSTLNGKKRSAIQLYNSQSSAYGKSSGLGDIALACSALPIEIGDFVWYDVDKNGIQDPGEEPLRNIQLSLFDRNCKLVGTTSTDMMGRYVFNSKNVDLDQDGTFDELQAFETYYIIVNDPAFNKSIGKLIYQQDSLIISPVHHITGAELSDNNAVMYRSGQCNLFQGYPFIEINTGSSGQNDYSFDIGFVKDEPPIIVVPSREYDLALIKRVTSRTGVKSGDLVQFNITVFNQGAYPVHQFEITDYLQNYFALELVHNPGWTVSSSKAKYVHKTILNAGGEVTIPIKLRLNLSSFKPNLVTNAAEISWMKNENGTLLKDVDSYPDDIEGNDKGGIPNSATDNIIDNNQIDEDDHDGESLPVIDLALDNKTLNSLPLRRDETASFEITIYNQGNVTVHSYSVVNYITPAYRFEASLNPGWILNGNKASIRINQALNPGESRNVKIQLILKSQNPSDLINIAEISGMWDEFSNPLTDIDSTPDEIPNNDKGGQLGTTTDNMIADDGTIDEDDHDPATIEIFDLALIYTTNQVLPVKRNQDVLLQITVCNQGNVPATNIGIVNHLASGLDISPLDNNGWFKMGTVYRNTIGTIVQPGGCSSLRFMARVKTDANKNSLLSRAEITEAFDTGLRNLSSRDFDSTPDYVIGNDAGGVLNAATDNLLTGNGIDDEDDEDPVGLNLMDLALVKRYTSSGSLKYKGTCSFSIQVFNQGNLAVRNVEITDYVPKGFILAANSVTQGWILTNGKAKYNINSTILPGASTTISITLQHESDFQPSIWINRAEISKVHDLSNVNISAYDFDSTPDDNPDNDAGGTLGAVTDNAIDLDPSVDEDDADPAGIPVFDLALRKTLVPLKTSYWIGDTIQFKIELFNQGNVVARDLEITDYLDSRYIFHESLNPDWKLSATNKIKIKPGIVLYPGISHVIYIQFVLAQVRDAELVPNYAEISKANDMGGLPAIDFDSVFDDIADNDKGGKPGTATDNLINDHGEIDEDDHDGAESNPEFFDLALVKDINLLNAPRGSVLNYRISIINQGVIPATEIEIVDYIPEALTLVDPFWVIGKVENGITYAYYMMNEANGRLPAGGLQPYDTIRVTIKLRVSETARPGTVVNRAEIFRAINPRRVGDHDSSNDDNPSNDKGGVVFSKSDGSSSEPDLSFLPGGDEDDEDPAGIIIIDLDRSVACECLNNATTPDNGQFIDELSFVSNTGDTWFIFEVNGLFHPASVAPPAAPTPFTTGPGGFILNEQDQGDGTSIYSMRGKHVDGKGYSIILSNQHGVKLNTGVHTCYYNNPVLLQAQNNVCSGQTIRYEVKKVNNATYLWTLSGGGTILNSNTNNFIDVKWTGTVGSTYTLTVKVNHPDSCYRPLFFPVTIGSTNGPVSCIGNLQVSLSNSCDVLVTPQMLLVGGPYDYKSYALMIFNKDGSLVPNNKLFYHHIGKELKAKVINVCSGNSCWTNLKVEDKTKPKITCVNDTIDCTLMKSYIIPFVSDNCDINPLRIVVDETIENTPCNKLYSKIVTRIYTAKDESGNVSLPCTMNIFLKRIQLDSIKFPDSLTRNKLNPLICSRFAADSIGHPLPSVTGIPTYRGLPIWPNTDSKYCDYTGTYEDIVFQTGKDCIRKILRNWKFTIWYCTSFEQRTYPQLIEIVDTIPPTITCPYDITATTNSFTCNANVFIPLPKVFDSCGQILRIELSYPGGFVNNFTSRYITLPEGVHTLTFTAYDLCHNRSSCTFKVTVNDRTPPVAICHRQTVVTLDRFGEAWVPASVFDNGSFDDCHIKSMTARRMTPDSTCGYKDQLFRDSIKFCCTDVGNDVMVVFKVSDNYGNENTCMVTVEVQDKIIPKIYCPHDVTIDCDYHYNLNDLSEFGTPTYSDNCTVNLRDSLDVQINQCREGYIDRIFIAGNAFGQAVCVQRITIINSNPFKQSDITWPLDLDTTTCSSNALRPEVLPQGYGYPKLNEDFCDLIGVSYEDQLFHFISGSVACYKVIRNWKVINWCRYYTPGTLDPIVFTHQQIIKISNKTAPNILTGCRDTIFRVLDTTCLGGNVVLRATADDDCTPSAELRWEYHIDFNRDRIYDKSRVGVGGLIDASGFYPLGKHTIKYVFEDKCGNKSVCERNFEIINQKAPTAYCYNGLAASLVPMDLNGNGSIDAEQVTLWAKDFDRGSYHVCGYPLTFSFGTDTSVKSITYDCDSIGRRSVSLCVTAINGIQDCCNTYVDIQDNNKVDFCNCVRFPPNITISDCTQRTDPDVINSRPIIGLCFGCAHQSTNYRDSVVQNIPNTCFVVYRTWTVKFACVGEPDRSFDRTQIIVVTTNLQESDIRWPSDSVLVDNCAGSIDTTIIGEVPRFCVHGGNVMMTFNDRILQTMPDCIIYERTWTVFSKCAPSQSYSYRQVLKVTEFAGVRYILPENITVSDCRATLTPGVLNGFPRTNCPCIIAQHSFRDSIVTSIPNTCYVIHRKWTSSFNCPPEVSGTFNGTQIITIRVHLTQNNINWPDDSIRVDNCRGLVDTSIIGGVPRLNTDFCGNVSIRFTDQTISQNDSCRIIHRTWLVVNDCSAFPFREQFSFVQVLKVTKPDGPKVDFPDDITVTDCKQSLSPQGLNGFPGLNCPCNIFTHTFSDSVVMNVPNTCYVVYRRWTSVYNCPPDVSGTFRGTQKITVRINLNPNDIDWPSDTVQVDNCLGSVDTALINHTPKLLKDYCGYVVFRYTDQIISQNDTCRFIRRTWVADNTCTAAPNKQQFTFIQILKVTNPQGPRIKFPANLTITDCDKPFLPDSLNGFPVALCLCDSILFSYEDDTSFTSNVEVCYIVSRVWKADFKCDANFDTAVFHTQFIVRDVNLNPADITWPVDSFTSLTCNPTLDPKIVGEPSLKVDYCGFVHFEFTDREEPGGECRTIKRTWTAINDCSLQQRPSFEQYIIVKNQDPPSITCQRDTTVLADPNTCGKVLQLRNPRLNNTCNGQVTFTNNAPQVFPVGMTNVIFTATDSCNNVAMCTVKVTVIETVPPEITCPADTLVPCSVNTDDLTQFGQPIVSDNCPGVTFTETVTRNQNDCGIGTIIRKFVAIDASGNRDSCLQRITVENTDPLEEHDILWPPSPISVEECDGYDPSITGVPEFDETGITCYKPLVTYIDTHFCQFNGLCMLRRDWSVYDTCTDQTFTFMQMIFRNDTIPPNILGVNDTTVVADDSLCNNFITLVAFVDNCDKDSVLITNDSPYGANGFEDASGFYPPGETFVTFTAKDPCCNVTTKTVKITVIDTIAPEFTCIKVVKKIKDNGCADFNSQEFIGKIKDNCTDSALIMSSFDINDFTDTIRTICCDSITNFEFTTGVTVYFKDQAGNIDSCHTFLQAVDQDTICGPTFRSVIKGFVSTRKKVNIPGVDVMLNDGSDGMTNTAKNGAYRFPDMPNGGSYVLKAEHDMNPLNGVSTADIIHIQRHILGLAPFDTPLKYVAADVNSNNRVTSSDIVEIRKLILGKIDRFSKSQSWKFILSNYTFNDLNDPLSEDYPQKLSINGINKNYYVDFTGIKIGDVDDSNIASQLFDNMETRSANPVLLVARNEMLLKDQEYEIELSMSQFKELNGMQFAIHLDPDKSILLGIDHDLGNRFTDDMYYLIPEKNMLRLTYNKSVGDPDEWKIRLKFRVSQNCQVSEILEISQDILQSEAYFKSGESAPVQLDFVDQYSEQSGLSLYQNIPNPFKQSTVIPFQTSEDMEITLRIINMNGKVILENTKKYNKGYHEFEINKGKMEQSGIYYYQLKTTKNSLHRRMIFLH